MNRKIENTIKLEGLIEGPLPPDEDAEDRLSEWVRTAEESNLHFDIQFEGSQFSLLAGEEIVRLDESFPKDASHRIQDLIQQLLDLIPKDRVSEVFSTLRSVEYRKDYEVQTLYPVRPDGHVEIIERRVEAETVPSDDSVAAQKSGFWMGVLGIGGLIFAIVVGAYFFDYRRMVNEGIEALTPLRKEDVVVKNKVFRKHIIVVEKEITGNRILHLTVRRNKSFPDSSANRRNPKNFVEQLVLQRLMSGYIRVEMFDRFGHFITSGFLRVKPLHRKSRIKTRLPLPQNRRPEKIVLTY